VFAQAWSKKKGREVVLAEGRYRKQDFRRGRQGTDEFVDDPICEAGAVRRRGGVHNYGMVFCK
jgi:hypothetical protein